MTAPAAQSTVAVDVQAQAISGMSAQAQVAVASYLAQVGRDDEIWYDAAAITEMAKTAARISDAFSVNVARAMDSFTADAVANVSGRRYRPVGVRNTVGSAGERGVREGVTTAGVFGRSADTYRYQQSLLDKQFIADVAAGAEEPTELASALDAATNRAQRAAQLNAALAGRNQARATMAGADGIIGYRRVLHAELDKTGSCGLCIASSVRIYRIDHLMPMHPGCHCVPVPVGKNHDPGDELNKADFARLYGDAHGTSTAALRATRYKVDEHGEIGPVLRPFGDPIRKEDEARRDTNRRRPKSDAERARTLRSRRDALEKALSKAPTSASWKTRSDGVAARIARLDADIVRLGG